VNYLRYQNVVILTVQIVQLHYAWMLLQHMFCACAVKFMVCGLSPSNKIGATYIDLCVCVCVCVCVSVCVCLSTGSGRNTWRFGKTFECNRWRRKFVLERSFSETQNISVAMERWSVEHRDFAVETIFKNNDSVLTQRIFRRHFNIHRNECP